MNKLIHPYRLLIVEDNPGDYFLLEEAFSRSRLPIEKIFHADKMAAVPALIKDNVIDIILLDLSLPDSLGVDSVITMNSLLPKTPIIVFSGLSTIDVAVEAISLGAQDYLVKGEFDEKLLAKTVQYSIERKKTFEKLRESNERYEFVNKATQDTIWEWDYKTQQGIWGDGFIKIFGYPKDKLKYGKEWVENYINPDDKERIVKSLRYHCENGLENWQEEYRFLCADGSYKEVFSRGYILYDENRSPYRMIGAMSDLTEEKRLEKELVDQQLAQQKLITEVTIEAQEKQKNELGQELHDNINQILATVKMYLGLIKSKQHVDEDLISKSYEYVNEAMMEIRKLSHSLVAPSLGSVSLKAALEKLLEDTNMSDTLHVKLKIDEKYTARKIDENKELMLYRIVQEQLNNITKYADAKQAVIELKIIEDKLYLSISDNGKGFDTTQKSDGIGLKNMSSRVEFYAGSINIISAPGEGCTIEICVP